MKLITFVMLLLLIRSMLDDITYHDQCGEDKDDQLVIGGNCESGRRSIYLSAIDRYIMSRILYSNQTRPQDGTCIVMIGSVFLGVGFALETRHGETKTTEHRRDIDWRDSH
jgi:hypothetical protein